MIQYENQCTHYMAVVSLLDDSVAGGRSVWMQEGFDGFGVDQLRCQLLFIGEWRASTAYVYASSFFLIILSWDIGGHNPH
jgi:hypothetical protein